jgi:autotransporter-associated beta strand protein
MDVAADLRLNGNNLTVSNLSSINSGSVTGTGATIRNAGTTPATLTVGSDNTSSEFDGTFLNGGAAPLGLTKVGTGTLTLTGVNTNTGNVTVLGGSLRLSEPGSFDNASAIAVGTGGSFDASGRLDTTLTLNAGQTLEHAGGVAGPITVTGNVNLGGTLLLAVTHAGLASDTLAVSGNVTYGGTLTVTNIGAALQPGDSFQLFPGATPGFTAFNLQTVDARNNSVYTWNNTVVTDGKVTVASVSPLVNTNAAPVTYSASGGNLTLSWPSDHLGWYLQTETNSLSVGLSPNWITVPSSMTVTQLTFPVNTTNGAVFFRLVYTNLP